jgi:hypothetical protein
MSKVYRWHDAATIPPMRFDCPHFSATVAATQGYIGQASRYPSRYITICPACQAATYFDERGRMFPAERMGRNVKNLPDKVSAIYEEARAASSVNAYTACLLLCRTLLSHVAVERGAKKGDTFQRHLKHLFTTGDLPTNAEGWADTIRTSGGEAAHELVIATKDEAHTILTFSTMVLELVYEYSKSPPKA